MLALLMGVGVATHVYVKVNSPNPQWLIYMTNQVKTISKVLSKHFQGIALLAIHQRPKKSKLSGWQTLTRKNFPDEVRKSFSRQMHQKSA